MTDEVGLETIDVYYLSGPFGGYVGRFPCVDGFPIDVELPVVAEDSDSRIEGVYVLDGTDIEGRPLFRWEQREAPAPDPDD